MIQYGTPGGKVHVAILHVHVKFCGPHTCTRDMMRWYDDDCLYRCKGALAGVEPHGWHEICEFWALKGNFMRENGRNSHTILPQCHDICTRDMIYIFMYMFLNER